MYKRQAVDVAADPLFILLQQVHGLRAAVGVVVAEPDAAAAVSYTHLDVYKRQDQTKFAEFCAYDADKAKEYYEQAKSELGKDSFKMCIRDRYSSRLTEVTSEKSRSPSLYRSTSFS